MPERFTVLRLSRLRIHKVGINPCVDLSSAARFFAKRGYIPVVGKLNSISVRATLVPIGNGKHRFFVNADMIRRAKVAVGDRVSLELRLDGAPRTWAVPADLRVALRGKAGAMPRWKALAPSRRKEIARYLGRLKNAALRKRRIASAIRFLTSAAGGAIAGIRIPGKRET